MLTTITSAIKVGGAKYEWDSDKSFRKTNPNISQPVSKSNEYRERHLLIRVSLLGKSHISIASTHM